MDDDVRTMRFDEWSKNLIEFAKAICDHVSDQADRPCIWCVKAVGLVTRCWLMVLLKKNGLLRMKEDVPAVGLDDAYFIAAGLLDPEVSVAIKGWGPA